MTVTSEGLRLLDDWSPGCTDRAQEAADKAKAKTLQKEVWRLHKEMLRLRNEVSRLEEENVRLKSDLEALQTGQIMQLSQAASKQRRAIVEKMKVKREKREAVESIPDEKTKEELERQIKRIKAQLNTERSKVHAFMVNGKRIFDGEGWKIIVARLHPDRVLDPIEKAKQEKAFTLFTSVVPKPEF
jgi:predicted RNase H-like nuclease (RuvC/YqgF family)